MSDDAVKKQIVGVCDEISEKNGWTSFAINTGSQYLTRLSTKLPALIEQGRAAGNQQAVWTFKESQGGENPNKPGTHYTNRYLDGVEVGGAPSVPQAAQAHAPLAPGDKDRAITRMAVLKAAAEITAAMNPNAVEDPAAEVMAVAARFETWVYRDVDDIPF